MCGLLWRELSLAGKRVFRDECIVSTARKRNASCFQICGEKKENYIKLCSAILIWWKTNLTLTHNSIKFLARIIRDDLHIPFKFHNLRHTYATILAESGISPRYVQEMLGHSKLEFTLKYYTHITGHMAEMARMVIDEKINIWFYWQFLLDYNASLFLQNKRKCVKILINTNILLDYVL